MRLEQGFHHRQSATEVPRINSRILSFAMEKETKNTVRYQEQTGGEPPVVSTLYVQRWALGSPVPTKLTVTIEAAKP